MRTVAAAAAVAALALALFLPFAPDLQEGQAQQKNLEYEVLSGIRGDTRVNVGWHPSATGLTGGWEEGHALDLIPDYAVGKVTAGEPVHAALRHVSGPALKAKVSFAARSCKNVLITLYEGTTPLAVIEYVHVDRVSSVSTTTQWDLRAVEDAITSNHIASIADEDPECERLGYWSGEHLHQRLRVNGAKDVDSKRDESLDGVSLTARWVDGGIWMSPGSWVRERYFSKTTVGFGTIANSGGEGVSHRSACKDDARTGKAGLPEGHPVQVLAYGSGTCAGWLRVMSAPGRLCGASDRAYWNIWRGVEPTDWKPDPPRLTTACASYAPSATPTPSPTATSTPQCSVTVSAETGGSATNSGTTSGDCPISVTTTANPNTAGGYTFNRWKGDSSSSDAEITVTATANARTKSVTATFTPPQCSVTVSAETGGSATNSGTTSGDCPTSVTTTANPNTAGGYTFNRWKGDSSSSDAEITVTATANARTKSVTATFTPPQCSVTVSAETGGSATNSGTTSGDCPTSVTTTANPNTAGGYTFNRWKGNSSSSDPEITVTATASARTKSVTATFTPPQCSVTVSAETGGSATNSGTTSGDCPISVTTTANPNTAGGYTFNRWKGNSSSSDPEITVTATASARTKSVTATFTPPQCSVTVSAETGGSATNSGTTSGDCPISVTTTANPNTAGGYTFNRWKGNSSSSDPEITVTATASARTKSVTATFNPPPTYLVTVKKAGRGTGTVLPGSGQYRGRQTFTATATGSSTFGGWSNCDGGTGGACLVNVTGPRTITATFKPPQCTVVAVASKGGTVSGGGTVDCGTAVPLRASAKAGFCFSYWNQLIAPGDFAQATSSVCLTSGTLNVTTSSGTRNQIYQAVFRAKRSYTLTVVGGTGSGSYLEGTWATASAPAGKCFLGTAYIFKRWTGDSSSTMRIVRIKMDGNKSVTATFTVAGTCPFARAEAGETAPHVADDP